MRKIKLPLEMANGAQVRSLEELRENFDMGSVLGSFMNGKLLTWLNDRWLEDEAEQVDALSMNDPDLAAKLCRIFGVEYHAEDAVDAEEAARRQERLARLRQYTEDEEILSKVDQVAFDQEDLADLYDMGVGTIYLCAGRFKIPKSKQHLNYIPLADATADGIELKKKEAPPMPTAPKRSGSTRKVGMTDGKLFKVENGTKTELAIFKYEVLGFAYNDQYAFVSVGGNTCSVIRVDLETGEQKSIHDYFSGDFAIVGSFLVWLEPFRTIRKCDFDGDFEECLVPLAYMESIHYMHTYEGWVYYCIHRTGDHGDHAFEKVNVETGEIVSIGSAYEFCVGNGKLYVYSYNSNTVSEMDLDGTHLRTLVDDAPMISHMGFSNGTLECRYDNSVFSSLRGYKGNPIRIKV